MARKNYSYEKNMRAKAKAAKREAKREQKAARAQEKKRQETAETPEGVDTASPEDGVSSEADTGS